jgi:hypothetical protein
VKGVLLKNSLGGLSRNESFASEYYRAALGTILRLGDILAELVDWVEIARAIIRDRGAEVNPA